MIQHLIYNEEIKSFDLNQVFYLVIKIFTNEIKILFFSDKILFNLKFEKI
jgi:hypothetical protein